MTKNLLKKGVKLLDFLEEKNISFDELVVLVNEMNRIKDKNKSKKDLTSLTSYVWLVHGEKRGKTKNMLQGSHLSRRAS